MKKKDYDLIADCINSFAFSSVNNKSVEMEWVANLVDIFEYPLEAGNPRFDTYKFEEACTKGFSQSQLDKFNNIR